MWVSGIKGEMVVVGPQIWLSWSLHPMRPCSGFLERTTTLYFNRYGDPITQNTLAPSTYSTFFHTSLEMEEQTLRSADDKERFFFHQQVCCSLWFCHHPSLTICQQFTFAVRSVMLGNRAWEPGPTLLDGGPDTERE